MNANVMIASREYVEQVHTAETSVNAELIEFAKDFYRQSLTDKHIKDILSMSIEDKMWLITQYREESKSYSRPELDNLY